jgi:4-amino-4-deoxy-L-arabinose transferase-like glycosyltransferase
VRAPFRLALALLWLASLLLLLTGLGGPPLRDWDEGIVARVALELSRQPWPERLWPTYWGEPYLNKPPGLHWLVAAAIDAWRAFPGAAPQVLPPPWLLRLIPALIASLLPPLLALLQWRLRPGDRLAALLTGAIALTLLPLARHGHLLMLDGGQLVAMVLLWWAVLGAGTGAARRNLNSGLVAGLAASALLLLKAPVALPVLAGTLLLRGLEKDLRRRHWAALAVGLAVGLLPGLAWHGGHLLVRGEDALSMWLGQGFARVGAAIEGNSGGPLTPVLEVLEGGWPWLPLWPFGMALAWRQRRSRAGLWSLGLTLLTAAMVLPLRTQLPWYSLLLWPPFALVCAPVLAWLVRRDRPQSPPGSVLVAGVPRFWMLLGGLLLLVGLAAALFGLAVPPAAPLPPTAAGLPSAGAELAPALRFLAPAALLLGSGLLLGGWLLQAAAEPRRRQGLGLLLLADGLALALLFASPLWLWELNENWPVADGLALLQSADAGSDGGEVRLWRQGERPSLSWYAQAHIRPEDHINLEAGQTIWLLGLESAAAPNLRCDLKGQRGALRLERCRAVQGVP